MAKKPKKVGNVTKASKPRSHTEKLPLAIYVRSSHDTGDSKPHENTTAWPVANAAIDSDWADGEPVACYRLVGFVRAKQTIEVSPVGAPKK